MLKKVLSFALVLMMVFALAACGDTGSNPTRPADSNTNPGTANTNPGNEVPSVYPAEKVLIGVEISDPTESETITVQQYFAKLAETLNVEFKYSEKINNADDELAFIEDCAIAGCKGFIANYAVNAPEQARMVMEYGMYYYGNADDPNVYDPNKENEHYLGSTNSGNADFERGKAMGEWVVANGFDTVVYANGGADLNVPMFVNRQNGFYEGLGNADVNVIVVSGFPQGDQFRVDQSAALATDGLQAVCASFSGVTYWAQPIMSAGLSDTVKLATIGAVDQGMVDAFESGALSYLLANNVQRKGLGVALICNAADGNGAALRDGGLAMNIPDIEWRVEDYEMCKKLNDIQNGELVFSAEDLITICVAVNPEASYQTLVDLVDSSSQANLVG